MYIYVENYSERALEGTTEFITKSRPSIGTFYIPIRMTHGLFTHQFLKGYHNESRQIYEFWGFDGSTLAREFISFGKMGNDAQHQYIRSFFLDYCVYTVIV